jgi:hypothetical protein
MRKMALNGGSGAIPALGFGAQAYGQSQGYGLPMRQAIRDGYGGGTNIKRMDITPDGSTLVAIGNFLTVSGQTRQQIVKIDIPTTGPATARGRALHASMVSWSGVTATVAITFLSISRQIS